MHNDYEQELSEGLDVALNKNAEDDDTGVAFHDGVQQVNVPRIPPEREGDEQK